MPRHPPKVVNKKIIDHLDQLRGDSKAHLSTRNIARDLGYHERYIDDKFMKYLGENPQMLKGIQSHQLPQKYRHLLRKIK